VAGLSGDKSILKSRILLARSLARARSALGHQLPGKESARGESKADD
jgi:hypothetical protein